MDMNKQWTRALCGALAMLCVLAGCALPLRGAARAEEAEMTVRLGALKGPTAMGMAELLHSHPDTYAVHFAGAPDEMVALLASGQVDIAALPTNLAATLYNKTNGGVQMLALNTLGVLYILERGDTIHTVADLADKTVWATGQAATPEYTLNYILAQAGLTQATQVAYKAEHAELATLAAAGGMDVLMLPEPHVTGLLTKDVGFRIALDVTVAFEEAARQAGGDAVLSMGCWVVRKAFAQEHPEAVSAFLARYAASAAYVNANVEQAAQWVAQYEILPSAAVAARALPNSHIVCISGADMRSQIAPLLTIWHDANPASVGGALPLEDFYYEEAGQ